MIGLAAAGGVALFQGFLGGMAQQKQNLAAQIALEQLGNQQSFYNTSFNDRLKLLRESQAMNMSALMDSIPLMRRQAQMEYDAAAGAARVAIAESGASMTGSKQRLLESIDVQGLLNRRTVERNILRELQTSDLNYRSALFGATQSYYAQQFQIDNTRAGIQSNMGSTLLSGLTGGLSGFGTGLNIVTGIQSIK